MSVSTKSIILKGKPRRAEKDATQDRNIPSHKKGAQVSFGENIVHDIESQPASEKQRFNPTAAKTEFNQDIKNAAETGTMEAYMYHNSADKVGMIADLHHKEVKEQNADPNYNMHLLSKKNLQLAEEKFNALEKANAAAELARQSLEKPKHLTVPAQMKTGGGINVTRPPTPRTNVVGKV